MLIDYETLRLVWWALLGILLIGFVMTDGFDLGAAILLPFIGRSDLERRIVINSIGPVWEGNQVWLLLGAGASFAAWPFLYAAAFSGFYIAMLLALGGLIIRPVAFKFRSKIEAPLWRQFWDWSLCLGGLAPTVIFGVAFGNLFQGVNFTFNEELRFEPHIGFFSLLNPFGLFTGLVSLIMVTLHGAAWLNYKSTGAVAQRARRLLPLLSCLLILSYILAGMWLAQLDGYRITSAVVGDGPSNPMLKTVVRAPGEWLAIFINEPVWNILPALGFLGAIIAAVAARYPVVALFGSALVPLGLIGSVGRALFPFLLPSSRNPNASLTVWDSSSSQGTLFTMLIAVILFLPVVLLYTAWIYRVLRGQIDTRHIEGARDLPY
ncbi:MAG TPA: cytochrome d ubiquinol oxidase subunit II [Dongiaceae bacterium]|jgi:cytochrome d ubiquinol oxidase subunit II|nr:cytochrome d ubiquinol oxidase subunit II [Dongiaceae bacterium]